MVSVFGIFWESIKEFWDDLFILVLMNLLTAVLLVPVVTFPPALAALWNVGNLVASGQGVEWSDYFGAFKRYFWKSWAIALTDIVVGLLLYVNFRFYAPGTPPFNVSGNVSVWIRTFLVFTGGLWLLLQMYVLAMLLEQEVQRLRLAFRNAAILMFSNPGFTLLLGIMVLAVSAVSTLVPALWAMVTLALLAVLCNKAVQHLLLPHRERARVEAAGFGRESDVDELDDTEQD